MLKVTSDGRKLGLDQRIINPMLPDEDNTKVNQCVDNIMQIWRDCAEEKLTQVVFVIFLLHKQHLLKNLMKKIQTLQYMMIYDKNLLQMVCLPNK